VSEWPAGDHLASMYDALYRELGEAAPRCSVDAFVVRLHEASRAFGALALSLRAERDTRPDPLVSATLANAAAQDDTGALLLYAVAMVLGPRLLVTLRDYLMDEQDARRRRLLSEGSDVVVAEVRAVGATVARAQPIDDPAWADAARALVENLEAAGYSESLGHAG
jgi:hypothetical protein